MKYVTLYRLTYAVPPKHDGAERREVLHIRKVFANALFLVSLNLRNSKLVNKNIVEVDATGRYTTYSRRCV